MPARFSITLFLAVLLTACAAVSGGTPSATLFIVNSSAQPVCKVHLTSMDGEEIGALLVSMEQPLEVDDNVEMRVPVDYPLNIMVEDCEGNFMESVKDLRVPIEGLSYYLAGGEH